MLSCLPAIYASQPEDNLDNAANATELNQPLPVKLQYIQVRDHVSYRAVSIFPNVPFCNSFCAVIISFIIT